jgi:hypothetical protein
MAIAVSVCVCLAALCWLIRVVRLDSLSLGLPLAYMLTLLAIHVPGALAHIAGLGILRYSDFTETGIRLTAIGSVCFVAGLYAVPRSVYGVPLGGLASRSEFLLFSLIGGWLFAFALEFLRVIPSIGATVNKGSAIWMLGVTVGLRMAVRRRDLMAIVVWCSALLVYPIVILFLGAFLSYGSAAIIIVLSGLAVSARRYWSVVASVIGLSYLALSIFVTYFAHRDDIRTQVWGGASLEARIDSVERTTGDMQLLNLSDPRHLDALDQRLNQNFFVGLAASRIANGDVNYLYGRSVLEGLMSLIPRLLWPGKPVFGGSPAIVAEMTGLSLSSTTSFGVGNVMEFYINFGIVGVVVGFALLGWSIGFLDRSAAIAERQGAFDRAVLFYLPAVALIQPNGSIVELCGGAAAAVIAGFGWRAAWYRSKDGSAGWARFRFASIR